MIEIEQLNFNYGQGQQLFKNADLTLLPGNIYGLLGLNGAGKSTLLKLIAGLQFPDSGSVNVLSHDPSKRTANFLSKLFLLSESVVLPNITGQKYISSLAPFYPDFDDDQMDRFLTEFNIPQNQKLNALSHGQQKKFLLSFGLACNAELLMLDEPTNGLDIPSKSLFRKLVAESLSENQTIIVSSHQTQDLESLIDAIIVLYDGQVLFNQSINQITNNLKMSINDSRPDQSEQLLYSEQILGGYASVWQDTNSPDGQLDLEFLFKAATTSPKKFSTIFPK